MHVKPSPVKPALQEQVKPPCVSVHRALSEQLSRSIIHSFMSVETNGEREREREREGEREREREVG